MNEHVLDCQIINKRLSRENNTITKGLEFVSGQRDDLIKEQRQLKDDIFHINEKFDSVKAIQNELHSRYKESEEKLKASKFWTDLFPEGMNSEEVKNELNDFHYIMEQIPKIYSAVTGGTLSNEMYSAETVISVYEDHIQELIDKAIAESKEEWNMKRSNVPFFIKNGPACPLDDCPPGHFVYNDQLYFKSQYGDNTGFRYVFNDSGEFFHPEQTNPIIQPVKIEGNL